jgi:hypothetical protein
MVSIHSRFDPAYVKVDSGITYRVATKRISGQGLIITRLRIRYPYISGLLSYRYIKVQKINYPYISAAG